MRTLFGKIFVSFWLMMILTIMITVIILRLSKPESNELPPPLSRAVVKAEMSYQRHGERGLKSWTMKINKRIEPHKVYVLSESSDLLNRPIPLHIQEVADQITEEQKTVAQRQGRNVFFGYYLTDYQGSGYKLIFNHPPRPGDLFRHMVHNIWLVILIIALFTGVCCYLLARNFSRPIKAMQKATNALADGDLDVQISDQFKKRKDEIAELACDFDRMTQQLKHAYNHQSRLIQDMSHELRAPISRMQVALALLEGETDLQSEQGQAMFKRIQTEITQVEQIIKHTLTLPLFEQKQSTLEDREDMLETLSALIQDLQFENQTDLGIELNITPKDGKFIINTKDNWLNTILRNLISNALQYRQPDTKIEITLMSDKEHHKLSVTNHSQEMSDDQIKDIFEPFYRADKARTPGSTNLGLGLSIVKGLVTRLGGHIYAEKQTLGENETGFKISLELPKKTS